MPVSPFQRAATLGEVQNPTNRSGKRPGRPGLGAELRWIPTFLEEIASGSSVKDAALTAGVHFTVVFDRRRKDEKFREQWNEAADIGTRVLEQEAARRAFHGTLKPVFYKGERCGEIREYSDTLMIFLLKARKPKVYRDMMERGKANTTTVNVQQNNIEAAAVVREMIERGELGVIEEVRAPIQSGAFGHSGLAGEMDTGTASENSEQRAGEGGADSE